MRPRGGLGLRPRLRSIGLGLAAAAILGLALVGCGRRRPGRPAAANDVPTYGHQASETAFRAVLLTNGMVLFGKLHGLNTPWPVLTDVYYMRNVTDPKTHKSTSVLIKRGKEWHAPDRTIINAQNIVVVEPVTKGSKVMQIIAKEAAQNPAP